VQPLVFKGADFLLRHFQPHALGIIDLDLLVRREQLGCAKALLGELGYRQGTPRADGSWEYFDPIEISRLERSHYELAPLLCTRPIELGEPELAELRARPDPALPIVWVRGQPQVAVNVDLHFGVMQGLDVRPLLERSIPGPIPGSRSFCATDHLWLCAARYYIEAAKVPYPSLRHLAYLLAHLQGSAIDWPLLCSECVRLGFAPALYYTLRICAALAGAPLVPPDVVALLEHETLGAAHGNWGWLLAARLGAIEPCPVREELLLA
jgi:hypothetical protein